MEGRSDDTGGACRRKGTYKQAEVEADKVEPGRYATSSIRGRSRGWRVASGANSVGGRKKGHGLYLPTGAKSITDKDDVYNLALS